MSKATGNPSGLRSARDSSAVVAFAIRAELDRLREHNAELIAALQEIKKETDLSRDFRAAAECAAIARAAIDKSTGGKS